MKKYNVLINADISLTDIEAESPKAAKEQAITRLTVAIMREVQKDKHITGLRELSISTKEFC